MRRSRRRGHWGTRGITGRGGFGVVNTGARVGERLRAISVPRLLRLAEIYEVPADQLLPREVDGEISLVDTSGSGAFDSTAGFTIDLVRLHELDDPDAHILDRFATSLQRERQDFNGRMLTIRRSDLRVLASCMGRSLEELGARLEQLGLRAAASA